MVAGATRGAGRGIATALGEAGATVYCTGRSSRDDAVALRLRPPRDDRGDRRAGERARRRGHRGGRRPPRPRAGGGACATRVRDRAGPARRAGQRHLGRRAAQGWSRASGTPRSGSSTSTTACASCGSRIDTHLITSHHLLPLLVERPGGLVVEVTDGTTEYNADEYRISVFYDLAKVGVNRLAFSQGHELARVGGTAVAITPGFLRSEMMLEAFGVREENWREFDRPARLRGVGVAALRRPCRRRAGRRRRPGPVEPAVGHLGRARRGLRLHRPRRLAAAGVALHRRLPRHRHARPDPDTYR